MHPRVFARLVSVAEDVRLERLLALPGLERAVFAALASRFDAAAADGFEGRIVYELERPATGAPSSKWTLQVVSGRALLWPDDAAEAAVRLRMSVGDFVRVAARAIDPAEPILKGRAQAQGDLGVSPSSRRCFASELWRFSPAIRVRIVIVRLVPG